MERIKALYKNSLAHAVNANQVEAWNESHRENIRCKKEVEDLLENCQTKDDVALVHKKIIDEYGMERLDWILATNVMYRREDHLDQRGWACQFNIPMGRAPYDFSKKYILYCPAEAISQLIHCAQEYRKTMKLYDEKDCIEHTKGEGTSYMGKILVLKPETLANEYQRPEFQLIYALDQYDNIIKGVDLCDTTQTNDYFPEEFFGVIRDDLIPEWAEENLQSFLMELNDIVIRP